jgi:hypothetical protein
MQPTNNFQRARAVALICAEYHADPSTINRARLTQALEEQFTANDLYEQRLDYFLQFLPDAFPDNTKSQRKSTLLWCYAALLPTEELDLRSVVPTWVKEYWDTCPKWELPEFSSHAFFAQLADLRMPESLLVQSILGFARFFKKIDVDGILTWAFYQRYGLPTLLSLKAALDTQHRPLASINVYHTPAMSVGHGLPQLHETLPLPSMEELLDFAALVPDFLDKFLFAHTERLCNQPDLALLTQLLPKVLAIPCPAYDPRRHRQHICRVVHYCKLDWIESFPVPIEDLLTVEADYMALGLWKFIVPQLDLDKLADKCLELRPFGRESRAKLSFALQRVGLFVKLIRLVLARHESPLPLLWLHRSISDFNQYDQWIPLLNNLRDYRSTVMEVFDESAPFELMQCPQQHIDKHSDALTLRYELHRRRFLTQDTIDQVVVVLSGSFCRN